MAKILICDDSDFAIRRIAEILKEGGHNVVGEAKDGLEVVDKFRQLKPDIVTMDIIMQIDGIKAIKEIMGVDPKAKIIVISLLEDQQREIVEAIRSGAKGYAGKPIRKEVLLAEVDRVLGVRD